MSDKLFKALEDAGVEYTALHRMQTTFFSGRCCGADSDILADETLRRLARRVERGAQVQNFVAYTRRIARRVFSKYCENREKFISALRQMEYMARPAAHEAEATPDVRLLCVRFCLKTRLSDSERRLMIDWFSGTKSRAELAEECGWKREDVGKVSTRIHQLKERLGKCAGKCLKEWREKA